MRFALAAIIAVLVAAPAAADVNVEVTFEFTDETTLRTQAVFTTGGEDSQALREAMDSDGDGQVSQEEEDEFESFFTDFGEDSIGEDAVTLDGKPPTETSRKGGSLDGAVGPVESTDPVTLRLEFESVYDVDTSADRHVLESAGDNDTDDDGGDDDGGEFDGGQFVIVAPPGFTVTEHSLGDAAESDGRRLTLGFTNQTQDVLQGDLRVVFERGGDGGLLPGPGLLGLVAAIAAAAAVVGGRRAF